MFTKNERFQQIVDYLIDSRKVFNQSDLSKLLDINRSYITNIKCGKKPVTDSIVDKIVESFPEINRTWLLTGKGHMLSDDTVFDVSGENKSSLVPLLPVSTQGGTLNDYVVSIKDTDCEKIASPVKADFAITVTGDSMAPEYPSGAMVLVKKIDEKAFIEWGRVYVLDTCNGTVIKEIRKGNSDEEVECVSINTDPKYCPFYVRFADIYGVYRVIMCMSLK